MLNITICKIRHVIAFNNRHIQLLLHPTFVAPAALQQRPRLEPGDGRERLQQLGRLLGVALVCNITPTGGKAGRQCGYGVGLKDGSQPVGRPGRQCLQQFGGLGGVVALLRSGGGAGHHCGFAA